VTMRRLSNYHLRFLNPSGDELAHVVLTPTSEAVSVSTAPLVAVDWTDAQEHGETVIQLREAERYEYEVRAADNGADLRLRCSLATRRRSLGLHGTPDAGLIETRSFCGTLLLELVDGEVNDAKPAVASALLDVRSLKLQYRTEYRGMLRRLADELSGLVADARSSAKLGFRSSFEDRTDEGWLQIQLELLREILDSTEFVAALNRILRFPHERLSTASHSVFVDRPISWTPSALRQILIGSPRREIPSSHPLRAVLGVETIAASVEVSQKSRDLDTPENRFVKFALGEFRAFLTHAQAVFEASPGWGASAALSCRLAAAADDWLARGLFQEIGEMRFAPLGSPVLQRKTGYREVLRWWLRFRTAAELSWQGGEELFYAGQRDVASLYEYWLFFELLSWFCRKCRDGNRPAVEELVEGLDAQSPNLRLRKQTELGPFIGSFAGEGRRLNARFAYNRRFEVTKDRADTGSWTRRLQPDYTLTFWPEELTEADAELHELLVHVHFDAKYRVDHFEDLFGAEVEDADEAIEGNYKRQDLLKMHAYKDAIKRSQGAYVLYPGRASARITFRGFHEVIPGLGAFGVAPDENGAAQGVDALEEFLDEALKHLCNRTTTQERVSFHVAESYMRSEPPVPYGELRLPEVDVYGNDYRAPPPAEHMVLVAWYRNEPQRQLAEAEDGFAFVRLGRRSGALHVHPNIARVRHLLLRTEGGGVAPGLLQLREPGLRVYTRSQLRVELRTRVGTRGVAAWEASTAADDEEHIYAVFKTCLDPTYASQRWDGTTLMDLIEAFESEARNRPIVNLGRTSSYPRIISLRELLKTRLKADPRA
jgi:predicted component of viral defense system (DUF524 family)